MLNSDHVETSCIIQATGLAWLPEAVQVRLIVSRLPVAIPSEQVMAVPSAGQLPPFTRSMTIKLSEANWLRLRNLSYWQHGRANSQVAILNKALALYLAHYDEADKPIPEGEQLK